MNQTGGSDMAKKCLLVDLETRELKSYAVPYRTLVETTVPW